MLLELGYDMLSNVRRDGEPDPDRTAGGGIDRGVDPDYLGPQIEGRAARVAPIDWCVDLQEVVIRTFIDVAPLRRPARK
jgi:hypothetical protein